ncbi:MAG: hypothetical protein MMC23_004480 [Stictis urceolatum]|nr:hypothetical protein [Stictis urceolata]
MRTYYEQRASVPGTLLISEGTLISPRGGGVANVPGIWSDEQIAVWKEITDGVHARGSYLYCQLWSPGRAALPDVLAQTGHQVISSSGIGLTGIGMGGSYVDPKPAMEQEILDLIDDFAQAARNAIAAGFDGVEVHGANGYLIDQFTQDTCNDRTDRWGGSIENRARFAVEAVKAVSAAIGSERVGYRISPYSTFQGMRMENPVPQFAYLTKELSKLNLSYLHVVESRISGASDVAGDESIQFALEAWGKDRPLVIAGGYNASSALEATTNQYREFNVLIAFGRYFMANPDLPFRIMHGIEPNPYTRATFYTSDVVGYIDYPFSPEFERARSDLSIAASA